MHGFDDEPIRHSYPHPTAAAVQRLKELAAPVRVPAGRLFVEDNAYYRDGFPGTEAKMWTRASVLDALARAGAALGPDYGFLLFDAFRTRAAQRHLFETMRARIAAGAPGIAAAELLARTRQFVADPDLATAERVMPHNSGGAIDLTLTFRGQPLDMGTAFDDPSDASRTDWLETVTGGGRWDEARRNRRRLFHAMRSAGFVNYADEWWHYDLGDRLWAEALGISWSYGSLEDELPP